MIAPTIFRVGVSTNWQKNIDYRLYFRQLHYELYQIFWRYGLGSATCVPNFIEIGAQEYSYVQFYC